MKLAAVFVCLVVLAAAATAEDVNAVAKATYRAVDLAFVKRDAKAADAAMRPRVAANFKAIVGGRDVTYDNLLANFRGMFAALTRISNSTTKILSSKSNGSSATMRVFDAMTAYSKGRDGKMHRYDLTNTSEDVWKKLGGKWKLATSTTLSESRKVDGKLLRPV